MNDQSLTECPFPSGQQYIRESHQAHEFIQRRNVTVNDQGSVITLSVPANPQRQTDEDSGLSHFRL